MMFGVRVLWKGASQVVVVSDCVEFDTDMDNVDITPATFAVRSGSDLRLLFVLVGLAMVLVGIFADALGLFTWVLFFGGIVVLGMGLIMDSKEKSAAKARAARTRSQRGY